MFYINVIVPQEMLTEENVEKAIALMTKCVKENHPEVKEERFVDQKTEALSISPIRFSFRVLIFFKSHDPKMAGVKGKTMAEVFGK